MPTSPSFRVEYLITVSEDDPFCKTEAGFNNLLKTLDGLSIGRDGVLYHDLPIKYELSFGSIHQDKQRYFQVKFWIDDEALLAKFEDFLRAVRGVLYRASERQPQVLWDGIGSYYATSAYPKINELENLLRKLITKFMVTNVGINWTEASLPKEVIESVRGREPTRDANYLQQVDFIQLSNFLFKEYPLIGTPVLLDMIKRVTTASELNIDEIRRAIPRSNWDRYFSALVDCESEYLRLRWTRLYELRNQVAHNRIISRSEFAEVNKLYEDLSPKLADAIGSLESVQVSEVERESVSENAASAKNSGYREFLDGYNRLHSTVASLALTTATTKSEESRLERLIMNLRTLLNFLLEKQVISGETRHVIVELLQLRNVLVHQSDVIVPDDVLARRLDQVSALVAELRARTLDARQDRRQSGGEVINADEGSSDADAAAQDASAN